MLDSPWEVRFCFMSTLAPLENSSFSQKIFEHSCYDFSLLIEPWFGCAQVCVEPTSSLARTLALKTTGG